MTKISASRSYHVSGELNYANHPDDQSDFPGPALMCRICRCHYIIPEIMPNGYLLYKCPMGHFWYQE